MARRRRHSTTLPCPRGGGNSHVGRGHVKVGAHIDNKAVAICLRARLAFEVAVLANVGAAGLGIALWAVVIPSLRHCTSTRSTPNLLHRRQPSCCVATLRREHIACDALLQRAHHGAFRCHRAVAVVVVLARACAACVAAGLAKVKVICAMAAVRKNTTPNGPSTLLTILSQWPLQPATFLLELQLEPDFRVQQLLHRVRKHRLAHRLAHQLLHLLGRC
ncbi:hypothetical protein BD289DRAFT_448429 [Coniella lustricola]|uniref:Uncharacterized protein n=1 Tax=Coniella lustricola TaxID=2025994 RepID=A0A2T2ZS68_9PEZI|nr:hypothetical protein BD289DRAFT_448429 [Coniella lustricola]